MYGGRGEKLGRRLAHLGRSVVLWLLVTVHHGPCLVRIDELCHRSQNHACRAGVYECLDTRLLRYLHQVLRSPDIDLVLHRRRSIEMGRRGMNNGIWSQSLEKVQHSSIIGDIAIMVGNSRAGVAIAVCAEIEHFDGSLGMLLDEKVNNVRA